MDISINIQVNKRYIVINNTITYNSIIYNIGNEFIGISGITTYTGLGAACEIIQITESSISAYVIDDPIFPEQLTIIDSIIEINSTINNIVFPEQLTLLIGNIEYTNISNISLPKIIYAIN